MKWFIESVEWLARTIVLLAAILIARPAVAADAPRSLKAEVLFRLENPCPATGEAHGPCKGYVIDRIIPHACGGAEDPSNMQWQTLAEAKEKNKWERIGCRTGRKLVLPAERQHFTEAYAADVPPPITEVQVLPIE